jgi:hypothetical protein
LKCILAVDIADLHHVSIGELKGALDEEDRSGERAGGEGDGNRKRGCCRRIVNDSRSRKRAVDWRGGNIGLVVRAAGHGVAKCRGARGSAGCRGRRRGQEKVLRAKRRGPGKKACKKDCCQTEHVMSLSH